MANVYETLPKLKDLLVHNNRNDLICSVCDDVIYMPVECKVCKLNLCLICAEYLATVKKKCPKSSSEQNHFIKYEEVKLYDDSSMFKCVNQGCDKLISLNDFPYHIDDCSFLVKYCPFKNCEYKGNNNDLNCHIKKCEFSKMKCYLCGDMVTSENKSVHYCLNKFVEEMMKLEDKISSEESKNMKIIDELKVALKEYLKINNISSSGNCKKCFEPLSWITRSYISGATTCSGSDCKRHFRLWCQPCKIKYCVICAKPPTDGTCGCGAKQVLKELFSNSCDLCRQHIEPKGYRCQGCDYDICLQCFTGN
jgi:hypothetical protein